MASNFTCHFFSGSIIINVDVVITTSTFIIEQKLLLLKQ